MAGNSDEKYEKAAKQSQRDVLILLVAVLILVASYLTFGPGATSGVPLLKKSHLLDSPDMLTQHPEPTIEALQALVERHDANVRKIKAEVDIFETDPNAQAAAQVLQEATRKLLHKRYGLKEPYRVAVELEFQDTIPDFAENGKDGSFLIELAPSSLQPHSIYTFLEVARQWKGGAFHRIANHVLQVMVKTHTIKHLAFQEYSPEYPHKKGTVGYAGRPSGPAFYVSIQDNSRNHGPGSQQKHNPHEADSCFGTVVEGWDHVLRIRKVEGEGFLGDAKKHVLIKSMTIQVPSSGDSDTYVTWHDTEVAKAE
jgi:cyclophilin family peptidyl-prolyl cis-trans isomerase